MVAEITTKRRVRIAAYFYALSSDLPTAKWEYAFPAGVGRARPLVRMVDLDGTGGGSWMVHRYSRAMTLLQFHEWGFKYAERGEVFIP